MINREEARRQLEEMHSGYLTTLLEEQNRLGREAVLLADCEALCMAIEALSQPPRPKGQWEVIGKTENGANILQCSNCKRIRRGSVKSAFCRDCGAEMER